MIELGARARFINNTSGFWILKSVRAFFMRFSGNCCIAFPFCRGFCTYPTILNAKFSVYTFQSYQVHKMVRKLVRDIAHKINRTKLRFRGYLLIATFFFFSPLRYKCLLTNPLINNLLLETVPLPLSFESMVFDFLPFL